MININNLFFSEYFERTAIIQDDIEFSYEDIFNKKNYFLNQLKCNKILPGNIVAIYGDFTPVTISIFFALIENKNIIVPLVYSQISKTNHKIKISKAEFIIKVDSFESVSFEKLKPISFNELYNVIIKREHPGIVLFTSGTSGEPKGAVHDLFKLLQKFTIKSKTLRTLNFLLFDHWGGLNTFFHTFSNGGLVLAVNNRLPKVICSFIEKYQVELLPVSPTFLNLLLISGEYTNYDLSSLKLITYGSEPMPESTLLRIKQEFPNVKLQQTYGLIELGVMRSKSKEDGSLWVKIGGEGYETRVNNNLLEIKAKSAMLGYLNASSPFTDDGWFMTGDQVEIDGEYLKILGRKSEIINVGGEKVYPSEVESIILEVEDILEVVVYGEKNPIIGNIVCAKIRIQNSEKSNNIIREIKKHCKSKLPAYMIPIKIIFDDREQFGDRLKKNRANI